MYVAFGLISFVFCFDHVIVVVTRMLFVCGVILYASKCSPVCLIFMIRFMHSCSILLYMYVMLQCVYLEVCMYIYVFDKRCRKLYECVINIYLILIVG